MNYREAKNMKVGDTVYFCCSNFRVVSIERNDQLHMIKIKMRDTNPNNLDVVGVTILEQKVSQGVLWL
jgi:hypothetical protein